MSETRTVPVQRWAYQQPFSHDVPEVEAREHAEAAWAVSVPEGFVTMGEPTVSVHKSGQTGEMWVPVFGWDPETGEPLGHPDDFVVRVEGSVRKSLTTPKSPQRRP